MEEEKAIIKNKKKVGRPKLGAKKTVRLGACFTKPYADKLKKDGKNTGLGYAHFIRQAVAMMYDNEVTSD